MLPLNLSLLCKRKSLIGAQQNKPSPFYYEYLRLSDSLCLSILCLHLNRWQVLWLTIGIPPLKASKKQIPTRKKKLGVGYAIGSTRIIGVHLRSGLHRYHLELRLAYCNERTTPSLVGACPLRSNIGSAKSFLIIPM